MKNTLLDFIPSTKEEIAARGWDSLDILLVSGDSHVDHPSFGIAMIGRYLLKHGFKVALLCQPLFPNQRPGIGKHEVMASFRSLGTPKLFVGISSGVVDSMVNNYTAQKKVRNDDDYAPGGVKGNRPDRAVEVYAELAREAFPNTPIIAGGVEASFRRLVHYDYWENQLFKSILMRAPIDFLLFGMAEHSVLALAKYLQAGQPEKIRELRGVAYKATHEEIQTVEPRRTLPSFSECKQEKKKFLKCALFINEENNPYHAKALVQKQDENTYVVVMPPNLPFTREELDEVYDMPFTRKAHYSYNDRIPALSTVETSVTVNRGCFGGCTFCAITLHQGKFVQSRSEKSVLGEVSHLAEGPNFSGTITDLGGPTANMYGLDCTHPESKEKCKRASCLYPNICANLKTDHSEQIQLLKKAAATPKVKHLYIASGVRFDLALQDEAYMKELISNFVGGRMKVAPEHMDDEVLSLMGKPPFEVFEKFMKKFEEISKNAGKEQFLVPYFISAFPGSTNTKMREIEEFLKAKKWQARQIQDFIPLPMTFASVMYYTGLNAKGEEIHVARGMGERYEQRATLQYHQPNFHQNKKRK